MSAIETEVPIKLCGLEPAQLIEFKTAAKLETFAGLTADVLPPVVVDTALARHELGESWQWCAPQLFLDASNGAVLGAACYLNSPQDGAVAVGYGVTPEYQGHGIATEGLRLLTAQAFASGAVWAVTAETSPQNQASIRVLEKNGFVQVGTRIDEEDGQLLQWRLMGFGYKIRETRDFNFETWESLESFINNELMPWWHELTEKPVLPVNKELVPLFRGQANSEWRLETTLERAIKNREAIECKLIQVAEYFKIMQETMPKFGAVSGRSWDLPESTSIADICGKFAPSKQELAFMVYVRHVGFASPLLDWTSALNVAAFFAFDKKQESSEKADKVAIWVHVADTGNGQNSGSPAVRCIGPKIATHPRHVAQQAQYSVGLNKEADGTLSYASMHKFFFDRRRPVESGHLILKLTLPVSERAKVLEYLDERGINEESLMRPEDVLARALKEEYFSSAKSF